jgi:hypothetical protein
VQAFVNFHYGKKPFPYKGKAAKRMLSKLLAKKHSK